MAFSLKTLGLVHSDLICLELVFWRLSSPTQFYLLLLWILTFFPSETRCSSISYTEIWKYCNFNKHRKLVLRLFDSIICRSHCGKNNIYIIYYIHIYIVIQKLNCIGKSLPCTTYLMLQEPMHLAMIFQNAWSY